MADAGLGTGGLRTLYAFGVLSAAKALALALFAESLAVGISSAVAGTTAWHTAGVVGVAAAIFRGVLAWVGQVVSARAAVGAKEKIREKLIARILAGSGLRVGTTTMVGTRGLNELDNYYRSVLPALTNAAVIPLVLGARILFADWLSAVIIAITITLVPLFMALIGMHTAEKTAEATAALGRLSDHLVELAKGLPVLVGLGRAEEQVEALRGISEDYRHKTLRTLRVAFLSALALELISTISVALVAVVIGFRLVNGTVTLEVALLVLILAPECFAPFRDLGAAFHASRNGLDALKSAKQLIDEPQPTSINRPGESVRVSDLTVRFAGRSAAAIDGLDFTVPTRQITSIEGPSGCGKSTVLDVLAGRLGDGDDAAVVTGAVFGVDPERLAYQPQRPRFVAETAREELLLYAGAGTGVDTDADITDADIDVDGMLDQLGLAAAAGVDPEQLSPGEARRLALGRTFLRAAAGAELVLFDEPTAHLDDGTARVVAGMIADLRGVTTVVVVSHDAAITGLATEHVLLGGGSSQHRAVESAPVPESSVAPSPKRSIRISIRDPARGLGEFLRPAAGRYWGAAALGILAALFAMSLTTVSGWLIVRASEHPAVMYLMVAIVGVRFFGIGRSALRYAERLVTHDAVFESLTSLRMRLWHGLSRQGATSRKLLRGGTVLDHLVGAADQVRDLAPRVILPIAVALGSAAAVIVAVALLYAPALVVLLPLPRGLPRRRPAGHVGRRPLGQCAIRRPPVPASPPLRRGDGGGPRPQDQRRRDAGAARPLGAGSPRGRGRQTECVGPRPWLGARRGHLLRGGRRDALRRGAGGGKPLAPPRPWSPCSSSSHSDSSTRCSATSSPPSCSPRCCVRSAPPRSSPGPTARRRSAHFPRWARPSRNSGLTASRRAGRKPIATRSAA
ncbi:MAG: ABC transporter transmembrane domain-containing protein [Galbitalea sp.]